MADNDKSTVSEALQQGAFNRDNFLSQITAEINKSAREALKGKIKGLMAKRQEAMRAVAVIDADIDREIRAFEAGLTS